MPPRALFRLIPMILLPFAATAEVDVSNAGFFESAVDVPSGPSRPKTDSALAIERSFHSRSTHQGYFGFGWCSNLETTLKPAKRNLELHVCGGGRVITYRPWTSKKNLWVASDDPNDLIGWQNDKYIRSYLGGRKQFFDKKGLLTSWATGASSIEIKRQKDVPFSLRESNGNYWRISWKSGRLTEIAGPGLRSVKYEYEDQRLRRVKAGKSQTQYEYSSGSNLVAIVQPSGDKTEVSYDEKRDWVSSVKTPNGCVEALSYESPSPSQPFKAIVRKKCPGSGFEERVFVITPFSNSAKVAKVSQEDAGVKTEKQMDSQGRIARMTTTIGNIRQHEERIYDQLGRLSQWTADGEVKKMTYQGSSTRIDRITISESKPSRAPAGVTNLRYEYDKSGRPTSARVNEIIEMAWRYDERGRLRAIIDASGDEVTLSYDSQRPKLVSGMKSVRFGEIRMSFDESGRLTKSESTPKTDANRLYMIYQKTLSLLAPLNFAPAES